MIINVVSNSLNKYFIPQKEASDFLKISEATLKKFKKEGKLSYKRIGKRYYYTKKDLVNCI